MTKYPPRHAASNTTTSRRNAGDRRPRPNIDRVAYAAALEVLG